MQKSNMTTHYLHSIIDENQQLRLRVAKLSQIQTYTESLLIKCEQLQIDKKELVEQNKLIHHTNQMLKREIDSIISQHRQQIKMVILEHDSIMKKMQQQLKVIKVQYQRQIKVNDELKEQKQYFQSQLKKLSENFNRFSSEADLNIKDLRQTLLINQKQYQVLSQEYKCYKSQTLTQKQQLMKELYHLKAVVIRQMKRHIQQLQSSKAAIQKQNDGLKAYNQQIARTCALRQKQMHQKFTIIRSQNQIRENLLRKQLQTVSLQLINKTQQCQRRFNDSNILIDQNIRLKRQIQQSITHSDKLCYMLEQNSKQNQSLRNKLHELDKYVQQQTDKYKQDYFDQKDHNTELKKILNQKEQMINQKLREIKELLNITDQIQAGLKLKDKEISILKQQFQNLQNQLKSTFKELDQKNLELRTLQQKHKLSKLSIQQMSSVNTSLKKQILQLETTIHTLRRDLLNPRILNRDAEQKMQVLTETFLKQKQKILHQHRIQKQKIIQTHQFQIKQKDLQYLRKVEYFQQELQRLK